MLRFKTVSYEYQQPRIDIQPDGMPSLEDCIARVSSDGWQFPFAPHSDTIVTKISLLDPKSAETLTEWAAKETSSAAQEALKTGAVNALSYGIKSGAISGAFGASWAAFFRPATTAWIAEGLSAGWQGALVGACIGMASGVVQWWHLKNASQDDVYLAQLVRLRNLFQQGEAWDEFTEIYDWLMKNYQTAGPEARAAWVTTRAVIDNIILQAINARRAAKETA